MQHLVLKAAVVPDNPSAFYVVVPGGGFSFLTNYTDIVLFPAVIASLNCSDFQAKILQIPSPLPVLNHRASILHKGISAIHPT